MKYIFFFLGLFSYFTYAAGLKEENILYIDKVHLSDEKLFFPNQDDVIPDKSQIKILSYFLLSSKSGERWATVTFENLSNGQRILEKNDITAIFANGEQKPPINLKQKFSGNQKNYFKI